MSEGLRDQLLRDDWPAVPDDGLDPASRDLAALEHLAGQGDAAMQLIEPIRRGIGRVEYSSPGTTLMRVGDGNQILIAADADEGRSLIASIEPTFMTLCTLSLMDEVCHALEFTHFMRHHLALYEKKEAPSVDPACAACIRPLELSWAPTIAEIYQAGFTAEELEDAMRAGTLFGAFDPETNELIGFAGEHREGSIGILQIKDFFRRKGWAEALEATKIAEHLSRGWLPWCQIDEGNDASLALQEKLGFRLTPPEQVFLW